MTIVNIASAELIDLWPTGAPLDGLSAEAHLAIWIALILLLLGVAGWAVASMVRLSTENRMLRERGGEDDLADIDDDIDDDYGPEFDAPPEPTHRIVHVAEEVAEAEVLSHPAAAPAPNSFMGSLAAEWGRMRPQFEATPGGEHLRIPQTDEQRRDFCYRYRHAMSILLDPEAWIRVTEAADLNDDGHTPTMVGMGETSDGLHLVFDADPAFPLSRWISAVPTLGRALDSPDATMYVGGHDTVVVSLRGNRADMRFGNPLALGGGAGWTPQYPQPYAGGYAPAPYPQGYAAPQYQQPYFAAPLALPSAEDSLAAPTGDASVDLDYGQLVQEALPPAPAPTPTPTPVYAGARDEDTGPVLDPSIASVEVEYGKLFDA